MVPVCNTVYRMSGILVAVSCLLLEVTASFRDRNLLYTHCVVAKRSEVPYRHSYL